MKLFFEVIYIKYASAIEVLGGKGIIFITGEVSSKTKVNVKKVVKLVLYDARYNYKL